MDGSRGANGFTVVVEVVTGTVTVTVTVTTVGFRGSGSWSSSMMKAAPNSPTTMATAIVQQAFFVRAMTPQYQRPFGCPADAVTHTGVFR